MAKEFELGFSEEEERAADLAKKNLEPFIRYDVLEKLTRMYILVIARAFNAALKKIEEEKKGCCD